MQEPRVHLGEELHQRDTIAEKLQQLSIPGDSKENANAFMLMVRNRDISMNLDVLDYLVRAGCKFTSTARLAKDLPQAIEEFQQYKMSMPKSQNEEHIESPSLEEEQFYLLKSELKKTLHSVGIEELYLDDYMKEFSSYKISEKLSVEDQLKIKNKRLKLAIHILKSLLVEDGNYLVPLKVLINKIDQLDEDAYLILLRAAKRNHKYSDVDSLIGIWIWLSKHERKN